MICKRQAPAALNPVKISRENIK